MSEIIDLRGCGVSRNSSISKNPAEGVVEVSGIAWEVARDEGALNELAKAILADRMMSGDVEEARRAAKVILDRSKGMRVENVDKKIEVVVRDETQARKVLG